MPARVLRGEQSSAADAAVCRLFRIVGSHENGFAVFCAEAAKIYRVFIRVKKIDT